MENENISFENDDDFLAELESDRFVSEKPKLNKTALAKVARDEQRDVKRMMKEAALESKQQAREAKIASKTKKSNNDDNDTDSLYGDKGTEILGDRRGLLIKVKQFKSLFSDNPEIKKFKLKKNPSVQDLNDAIVELQAIVDCSSVETFCESAILSAIGMVEGISSHTNYDISGLSLMLKSNKEFHNLSKILFIKYSIFAKVPPELQMVMLVGITASMCLQKNRKKGEINAYLNSTI